MKKLWLIFFLLVTTSAYATENENLKSLSSKYQLKKGFVSQLFDQDNGKLYLKIDNLNSEFIYQTSLPQGLGSNDIGLDRGQLGNTHLVEFQRIGNKVLLIQKNTKYRAISDNKQESRSVDEAFASSILWSFPVVETNKKWVLVDASDFILHDSHGVVRKLAQRKQGSFKLDKSRSAIYLPRTKSFPDNTELEASITFTSDKPGKFVQQAAINPNVVSLRMHHSFIRLPKAGYKPRNFHPQSGFWSFQYQDYAQPINKPITQRFIARHRLSKKNPLAGKSEAVEPIIYYLDPGAPEPVKTALINGASWWNQAFESIGYIDAFQVKILPENADPLDVRYNVIQWVHRATRGWSYGYSVTDPRNGEIIKGHVTLGSLRVRQDYLIAQGMLSKFAQNDGDQELMDLALARIRQLSAHEVGHTLGLAHNFAASTYGRESVMDYPHPLFEIDGDRIVSNNAYKENIGLWDKTTIAYGYQSFDQDKEASELTKILKNNQQQKMLFISDPDSRKISDAHPMASLWDNGSNTIDEFERVIDLRRIALLNFGEASLHSDRPLSDLQEILIPVYYFHRYQATAAGKWIGGLNYDYAIKDSSNSSTVAPVSPKDQIRALEFLLNTFEPEFLTIKESLRQQLFPKAYGYQKSRESSQGNTGTAFDFIALASASVQHSLSILLDPQRLARVQQQKAVNPKQLSIAEITSKLHDKIVANKVKEESILIHQSSVDLLYSNYINLLHKGSVSSQIKTEIYATLLREKKYLRNKYKRVKESSRYFGFYAYQLKRLENIEIKNLKKDELIKLPKMPPGSPI